MTNLCGVTADGRAYLCETCAARLQADLVRLRAEREEALDDSMESLIARDLARKELKKANETIQKLHTLLKRWVKLARSLPEEEAMLVQSRAYNIYDETVEYLALEEGPCGHY